MERLPGLWAENVNGLYKEMENMENNYSLMAPFPDLNINWSAPWKIGDFMVVGKRIVVVGDNATDRWLRRIDSFKDLWNMTSTNLVKNFDQFKIDERRITIRKSHLIGENDPEDLKKEIRFFKKLQDLARTAATYSKEYKEEYDDSDIVRKTALIALSHDFASESFFFSIVVNEHRGYNTMYKAFKDEAIRKEVYNYSSMHGGLIYHPNSNEWGTHT